MDCLDNILKLLAVLERSFTHAAHAVSVGAVLVSRDKAFGQVPERLRVEIW